MYMPLMFSPLFIIVGLFALIDGGNSVKLIGGIAGIVMGLILLVMGAYFFRHDKRVKSKQG